MGAFEKIDKQDLSKQTKLQQKNILKKLASEVSMSWKEVDQEVSLLKKELKQKIKTDLTVFLKQLVKDENMWKSEALKLVTKLQVLWQNKNIYDDVIDVDMWYKTWEAFIKMFWDISPDNAPESTADLTKKLLQEPGSIAQKTNESQNITQFSMNKNLILASLDAVTISPKDFWLVSILKYNIIKNKNDTIFVVDGIDRKSEDVWAMMTKMMPSWSLVGLFWSLRSITRDRPVFNAKRNTIDLLAWELWVNMPLWSIMKYFDWNVLDTEGVKKEIILEIKKWMIRYKVTRKDREIYKEAIS